MTPQKRLALAIMVVYVLTLGAITFSAAALWGWAVAGLIAGPINLAVLLFGERILKP